MLKIGSVRWKGRCGRHPRFNPEIDGLGGIRGGCKRCEMLLDIYTEHAKLVRLMREFGTRDITKAEKPRGGASDPQMSIFDLVG